MNKIRFSVLVASLALILATGSLQAQTSFQRMHFSLMGYYQTNTYNTNLSDPEAPLTNTYSQIHPFIFASHNIVKAIAIDLLGTNWTNWSGAALLREVNMVDGTEGIFLRVNGVQTNVSSFFEGSFSNNFTGQLTNMFPGATNNFSPQFTVNHGWTRMPSPGVTNTNYNLTEGIYYLSLNTTNLKFNIIAVGSGGVTNLTGGVNGTPYQRQINYEFLGTDGTFYLNVTTNFFGGSNVPPQFYTGPIHGTVNIEMPSFSSVPGP